MIWRALGLLVFVIALSLGLTFWLGHEVLLALGLILTQIKVIAKKLMAVEATGIFAWLKVEARAFFQVELLKKWAMTSLVPMIAGNALLRRIERFVGSYKTAVAAQYKAMMDWYRALGRAEKVVATLIVLFATLALTVSSLGLWLVLFSVKLPIWFLATVTAFGRMTWQSLRKWAFKATAFFQLSWAWRLVRRRLPEDMLEKKRRLDFRLARKVVRQRRMTVRQLAAGKDGLALRWALFRAWWRRDDA